MVTQSSHIRREGVPMCEDTFSFWVQFFYAHLVYLGVFELCNDIFAETVDYIVRQGPQVAFNWWQHRRFWEEKDGARLPENLANLF